MNYKKILVTAAMIPLLASFSLKSFAFPTEDSGISKRMICTYQKNMMSLMFLRQGMAMGSRTAFQILSHQVVPKHGSAWFQLDTISRNFTGWIRVNRPRLAVLRAMYTIYCGKTKVFTASELKKIMKEKKLDKLMQ